MQSIEIFQQFVESLKAEPQRLTGTLHSCWGGVVQLGVRRWAAATIRNAAKAIDHVQLGEALGGIESVYQTLKNSDLCKCAQPGAHGSDHLYFLLTAPNTTPPAEEETRRVTESLLKSVAVARLVAGLNSQDADSSISRWLPAVIDPAGRLKYAPTFSADEAGVAWSKQDICRWLLEQSRISSASSDLQRAFAVARYMIEQLQDECAIGNSVHEECTSVLDVTRSSEESCINEMRSVTAPVLFDYLPSKKHVDARDFIGYLTLTASSGAGRLIPDPDMYAAFDQEWLQGLEDVWATVSNNDIANIDVFWKLETRRYVEVVGGPSAQAAFRCAIRCLVEGRPWPKGLIITGALTNDQLVEVGGVSTSDFLEGGKLWAFGDKSIPFQVLAVPKMNYESLGLAEIRLWEARTGKTIAPRGTLDELFRLIDEVAKQESQHLRVLVSMPEYLRVGEYEVPLRQFFEQQKKRFRGLTDIAVDFSSSSSGYKQPQSYDMVIGFVSNSLGERLPVPETFYEHPSNHSWDTSESVGNEKSLAIPVRSGIEIDILAAIRFAPPHCSAPVLFLEHPRRCDETGLPPETKAAFRKSIEEIRKFREELHNTGESRISTRSVPSAGSLTTKDLAVIIGPYLEHVIQRKSFSEQSVRNPSISEDRSSSPLTLASAILSLATVVGWRTLSPKGPRKEDLGTEEVLDRGAKRDRAEGSLNSQSLPGTFHTESRESRPRRSIAFVAAAIALFACTVALFLRASNQRAGIVSAPSTPEVENLTLWANDADQTSQFAIVSQGQREQSLPIVATFSETSNIWLELDLTVEGYVAILFMDAAGDTSVVTVTENPVSKTFHPFGVDESGHAKTKQIPSNTQKGPTIGGNYFFLITSAEPIDRGDFSKIMEQDHPKPPRDPPKRDLRDGIPQESISAIPIRIEAFLTRGQILAEYIWLRNE